MSRMGFAFLFVMGIALGFEYRVDQSGGPLILEDEVADAVEEWQAVEESPFEAQETKDADTLITYGSNQRFGPDLYSLTVSRVSPEGRELRVLLNPTAGELLRPALLHEIGILAGLREAESGVMNPRVTAESPRELTPQDREALLALVEYAPEDINRDGAVDFYDLAELARAFGRTGVNLSADLNQDGIVDERDLELLRAAYTFSPPNETLPEGIRPPAPPEGAPSPEDLEAFDEDPLAPPFDEDPFDDEPPLDEDPFDDEPPDDDFDDDWDDEN